MVYNDEMIAARIKSELDKVKHGDLPKTAFTISISDWNLTDGKYLAVISSGDLTAENYAEVFFDDSCSEIVSVAKISTEGETFEGGISITAENLPTDSIQGSYYIFKVNNFMSKASTGSYQETASATAIASSVEYPLGTATEKIAENLSELAKNAGVTLSGGGEFVINGDTVQEVTLSGADYSYDSATKKASVADSGT